MSPLRSCCVFSVVFVGLSWVLGGLALRSDWREYIDRDLYKKYVGKAGPQFNRSFFQGDIDKVDRDVSGQEAAKALSGIKDAKYQWPNAVVPFTISTTFADDEQMRIRDAITAITELTSDCIRFTEHTTEMDYIKIVRGVSCSSSIGRQGGAQIVSFTVGCLEEWGDVQHEILHSLGFYHEHSREDRDKFVTINWRNIREDDKSQFQKFDGLTFNLSYDYSSVMHYQWNAFPMNPNLPTMVPNEKLAQIGQRANLSNLDVQRIRKAYGCDDTANNTTDTINIFEITTSTMTTATTQLPSQRMIPIGATSRTPPDLILFNFTTKNLSDVECKNLNTATCFMLNSTNCLTSLFAFICSGISTDLEIKYHLEKIKQTIPSTPIQFYVGGKIEFRLETFLPVSDNIVFFGIAWNVGFNCDDLRHLLLPNLIELDFSHSTNITVNRDSLRPFRKMRVLLFWKSTILSLEKGSLESLVSLKTVGFDWDITLPLNSDERSYLWRLHCSAEYSWLRDYLDQHPELIESRKHGEIYSFAGIKSNEWTKRNLSYSVNCSKDDLTGNQNQVEFSLNDQLSLPDFKTGSLSDVECKALNSGNCFVYEFWANCPDGYFVFYCNGSSTDLEIRDYLEKIKRTIPSSPIDFAVGGKTELKPEIFLSVSDNILFFEIFCTDGFNCDVLRDLPLPNLLQLGFYSSINITINRGSFIPFQKMRSLILDKSSILSLEKGSIESLINLGTIVFDGGIALPLSSDERSYLWRLHCSAEHSWLRDYLNQHPQLIQPRKEGEIYSLPGVRNFDLTRRMISYPVDCNRSDLTGDQNQVEFSLNGQEES